MKKITILILSISLYAGMFEHNVDLKSKYWFDSSTQEKNERLASELVKFQNNTATLAEIDNYLKAKKDDNDTKVFSTDIFVDKEILKEMNIDNSNMKVKDTLFDFKWFFSFLGSDDEQLTSDENATIQTNEVVNKEKIVEDVAEKTQEEELEERGAFQDDIDSKEPEVEDNNISKVGGE